MIKSSDDTIFDPAKMNVVTVYAAPNYPISTDHIFPYPPISEASNPVYQKILYICDGKRCDNKNGCGECKHTTDITHAKNFKATTVECNGRIIELIYVEQEDDNATSEYECYNCGEVFSTSCSNPKCPACGSKECYKEDSDESKQDAPS